jgi:glycosyltransferase involved in cell wall biosynthesis
MTDEIKVKPVEQKRPSLMIATPMYGGMCTGTYVQGLLMVMNKMREVGVNVSWCQITNESLITRARNELARIFMESQHDYLMFIDADIGFDGESLIQLMAADKDVACGIYPKKEVNWDSVKRAVSEGKSDIEDHAGAFVFNMIGGTDAETDTTGCIQVRHGGTGFMLIKRGVFEHLKSHVPTYRVSSFKDPVTGEYQKPLTYEFFATSIDESGALLSEDYHFCELVRAKGGEVWANPFIRLTHTGTYVYDGDILKSGGNLK